MAQWWDAARIDATVTQQFVESNLSSEDRRRLDLAVFAGSGLASVTYGDRIRTCAPRLFLLLVDLSLASHIFGLVNSGLVDEHLPLPIGTIPVLNPKQARDDDKLKRKFFARQFHYILRPLERGVHRIYDDPEVVPLEVVDRSPPYLGSRQQLVDRVKIPSEPEHVFCRRRYPTGNGTNGSNSYLEADLVEYINAIKGLQSNHIVSYWASYTHQGSLYVLFSPANDFSLRSFPSTLPSCYNSVGKTARRELGLNWILCLVDTVASLHTRDRSHGCIKPSTVLFTNQNDILLADPIRLSPESSSSSSLAQAEKQSFDREWYDYAAPEQWFRPVSGPATASSRPALALSSSSPKSSFSIPGSSDRNQSGPNAMLQTPNPYLDPQQADIFSLGCVILDLLTILVKRQMRNFAVYRSQRRKTPGRGGAVMDASFHKNLGQVEGWMTELAKSATKMSADKAKEGAHVFRGVTPVLHIVTRMLSVNPADRPPAWEIQQHVYRILTETCGISEPHCVHQYTSLQHSLDRGRIIADLPGAQLLAVSSLQTKPSGSQSSDPAAAFPSMWGDRAGSSGGVSWWLVTFNRHKQRGHR